MNKSLRKLFSLALALALVFSSGLGVGNITAQAEETTNTEFTDIANLDDASKEHIAFVNEKGILKGHVDGTFAPRDPLTRRHAAMALARALELELKEFEGTFPDVSDRADFGGTHIEALAREGIISGKTDGTFAPEENVTRVQFAKMVANAYKLTLGTKAVDLSDLDKLDAEETKNVKLVVSNGIVDGYTDGTFGPRNDVQRVHVAKFMTNTIEFVESLELTVKSVSAIKAKELKVTFNTAVDTSKAAITVKKGNVNVNVDKIEFAEDKMSAVITTTTQLTKGDYTVTVTGLTEEALVGTVTVENVKVSKINILSQTAPINPVGSTTASNSVTYGANETATIKYEVLNQYGEKMTGQPITWTQSTGGGYTDNTTTNTLTIGNTTSSGTPFIPGNKVYLTGVHASSATVVNAEVTIGLPAKAATAEMKGVYNTTTRKIEDLPAGFASNKYELLFQIKDQYGNVMTSPTLSELTFLSDNPLFVAAPTTSGATTRTIDNVTYQAVKLVPGAQADKGGTANLQIISNNTGNVAKFTVTADAKAEVKTFQIAAPSELIAGTDKVEIPFTAVDQYGNAVTKYSDLNGKVTLLATDGATFQFEQQKDGSAKLFYTAATNATTFDSVVSLTSTLTANGNYSNVQVTVKPDAKGTTIVGLNDKLTTQIAKGNTLQIKANDLKIQDQYGRNLTKDEIDTWITVANNKIVVESGAAATTAFTVAVGSGSDQATNVLNASGEVLKITASTASSVTDIEEKLVFALSTDGSATPIEASAKSITLTAVSQSEYVSYEVEDLGKMYNNGATSKTTGYDVIPTVYGVKADGTKVKLPSSQYEVSVNTTKLNVTGQNVIEDVSTSGFDSATDFKDGATKTVKVTVLVKDKYDAAAATIVKDLVVTDAQKVAETITLDNTKVTNGAAFVSPTGTVILTNDLKGVIKEVKDQYGVVNSSLNPDITISGVTTVDGSNFAVVNNGKANATINNPKAGDKFTATYKYAGGKTETVKFTVSSDTTAPTVSNKLTAAGDISSTGTHTLVFSEAIDTASRSAVKTIVDAAFTPNGAATVSSAWGADNKTLTVTIGGTVDSSTNKVVLSALTVPASFKVKDLAGNQSATLVVGDLQN